LWCFINNVYIVVYFLAFMEIREPTETKNLEKSLKYLELEYLKIKVDYGLIDLGRELFPQVKGKIKVSRKKHMKWANDLEEYLSKLEKEKEYEEAVQTGKKWVNKERLKYLGTKHLGCLMHLCSSYIYYNNASKKELDLLINLQKEYGGRLEKFQKNLIGYSNDNNKFILNLLETSKKYVNTKNFKEKFEFLNNYYKKFKLTNQQEHGRYADLV